MVGEENGGDLNLLGIITEHYAGAFPTWLAPVQVKVMPVNSEYQADYGEEVYNLLMLSTCFLSLKCGIGLPVFAS